MHVTLEQARIALAGVQPIGVSDLPAHPWRT